MGGWDRRVVAGAIFSLGRKGRATVFHFAATHESRGWCGKWRMWAGIGVQSSAPHVVLRCRQPGLACLRLSQCGMVAGKDVHMCVCMPCGSVYDLFAEVRRACAWAIGTAGEYSSPFDSGQVQRPLGARAGMQFTVRRSAVATSPSSGGVASAAGRTSPGAGKLTGGGTGVRAAGAFSAGRWAHVSSPPVLPVSQFNSREAFDHAVQVVALTAHKETPGGSFVEGRAPLPWHRCQWLGAHALILLLRTGLIP
jgi:hypothetical protein